MTSTTAESSAGPVHAEIQALFSWNPPRLIPPKSPPKKASTTTHLPAFYDKHFTDNLVLKRVERFPSLVQQLANNVDKALEAASNTLPQTLGFFITAGGRELDRTRVKRVVWDEKTVASFYDKTTAMYCPRVASTLALHPTASFSEWDSLLYWTQSGCSPDYAIMHGILYFDLEGDEAVSAERRAAMADRIESKTHLIFEKMSKSMHPLATWEIKGISAGSAEVMTAVPNLGKFTWTTCPANDCAMNPKDQRERQKVGRVFVGPDALATPWHLPVDKETNIQPLTSVQQPATGRVTRSYTRLRSSMLPPPQPSASEAGPSTKDKGKKRQLRDDDDDDEAYRNRHDMTEQNLVQQAWAQAVRVDGTVIVLHSGNHELVCIRHRATQTLYVSDIIEPPECVNPGYGKLQIGIYIAAIQETIDRKLQQLEANTPSDGGSDSTGGNNDQDPESGPRGGHKDGRGRRGGRRGRGRGVRKTGRFQGSARRKGPTDDEPVAIEKAIHVANNRDVVLLYLQYGIYDSPIPASFVRSASPIIARTRGPTPSFSQREICTCGLDDCLTIILTSEIGRGATGMVHRGTLKLDLQSGTMALDVVVKLAFDSEQRDALKNEYEIYRHLRSKGVYQGITTTLGIFDDSEDAACALVMLYAGVPLCEESQGNLSISDRESALSILKSIHDADTLHGDIRQENILIGDLGVTIVDFAYSKQCTNQRSKNEEFALLRNFLGLAGKSARESFCQS